MDGETLFSFEWLAVKKGKLTTKWSDVEATIFRLVDEPDELQADGKSQLRKIEKEYFDNLIRRRNLTRFRPSIRKRESDLGPRLAKRIEGFALSSHERQHLNRILYSPHSRGRRLILEGLIRETNVEILRSLLAMTEIKINKLTYDIVFRLDFIDV